jgi:uncharacterized Zn finger protein (UPF0148 family)
MGDEYISALSAKLLQGWCMTDLHCDDCMIPLMRDKQGDELCVACGKVNGIDPKAKDVVANQAPSVYHDQPNVLSKPAPQTYVHTPTETSAPRKASVDAPYQVYQVNAILEGKLTWLAIELNACADLSRIEHLLKLIKLTKELL